MFHTPPQHHIGPPAGQIRTEIPRELLVPQARTIGDYVGRVQAEEAIAEAEAVLRAADPVRAACHAMQEHGDTFARSIGRAIEYASPENRRRLVAAFPDLIAKWSAR